MLCVCVCVCAREQKNENSIFYQFMKFLSEVLI